MLRCEDLVAIVRGQIAHTRPDAFLVLVPRRAQTVPWKSSVLTVNRRPETGTFHPCDLVSSAVGVPLRRSAVRPGRPSCFLCTSLCEQASWGSVRSSGTGQRRRASDVPLPPGDSGGRRSALSAPPAVSAVCLCWRDALSRLSRRCLSTRTGADAPGKKLLPSSPCAERSS